MKKFTKLTALCLALFMAFSLVPVSLAAEADTCPIVYIPGISSSKLYHDVNDPESQIVFPSVDEVKKMVTDKIVPALIVYAADKDADKLASVFSEQFNIIFAGHFNNPDGTPKGNSGAIVKYPSSVSKGSRVTFDWDWRSDPFVAAAKLNDFINYVIDKSGCSKVALASHSLGSVVILTYLDVYGNDKITGIVYDSPAIDGVNYLGEFLVGNFETDGEALMSIVKTIFGASEDREFVESIMDVFSLAGIHDELSILLNSVFDDLMPVIFRDTLVPLFACWPSIWAMVPEEDTKAAMDYIFTKYLTDEASAALKSTVEKYNEVKSERYQTLAEFDKDGRFAVISRYGYASLPIMDRWAETGDTVIDTNSSSLGATTALMGEVLDDAYLAGKDAAYISPDKTVDASTCFVPEKTWFIKNLQHSYTNMTSPLYSSLLFGAEEATCDNFSLARFTAYDAITESLVEDTSEPEETKEKSPLEVLFNFIRAFFKKILSFFKIG